jgi:hypothetical protein
VAPPVVEKSYLTASEKPAPTSPATAAAPAAEPPKTASSPVRAAPAFDLGLAKAAAAGSPSHFVGGWKAPSPTKEISSPMKEERRKVVDDDAEDLTLLERVSCEIGVLKLLHA